MSCTRRRFLATAGVGAGLAAGWPRAARAQARTITLAHSVSTFVYGQHLVAKEKKFFEDEGVSVPGFIVPGGGHLFMLYSIDKVVPVVRGFLESELPLAA